ncbi:hypothetical protein L6452_23265 [Arctium lappa]|uniref:Uncharacterized protein n=1 Tax=Arctium lappa TaxID=4217 RepID=A0ACB9B627_ARCLA|nr:hypothetical protein L6452_23265 [Arctium lappa]
MAFPAAWIMEKYPNFVLARPDIFRRPWDSVIRPEEMLVPGQKYFVVPIWTVKKLRRRIWKPSIEITNGLVCRDNDTASSESLLIGKPKPGDRCVRFRGIESRSGNELGVEEDNVKKSLNGKGLRLKKNVHSYSCFGSKDHLSSGEPMSDEKRTAAQQPGKELEPSLGELSLEDDTKNTRTESTSTPSSPPARKSSSTKISCLCAPTTHRGSFRCRYHRSASVGSNLSELGNRKTASVGSNLYELGNPKRSKRSREF